MNELLARVLAEEQHLHRNDAVEAQLPRLIADAHAAARNLLQQFIIAKATRQMEIAAAFVSLNLRCKRGGVGVIETREQQTARTHAVRRQPAERLATFKARLWLSRCAHAFTLSATSP